MEFGQRLLPQVVDEYARTDPSRLYASIPHHATDVSGGFHDVTMAKLAAVVNRLAWWIQSLVGTGGLDAVAYIGPSDIRYAAMFLAAVKCKYKMLFISPRNQLFQNQGMIARSGCRAVFYAEEMSATADAFQGPQLQAVVFQAVPSLEDLLQTPEVTEQYPFEKSFEQAKDEPCLILHSSGSTGEPKLVTMTHGTFACTDNDRNMPVPEGRSPQNAAQFNFQGGGKFYSCFPPYHLAGVHAYIDLPIFSTCASVVFGPAKLPPSGYVLCEILKYQNVRAFYVPPSIIEQWAAEPGAEEQAKQLDFVLYGGGPLSPHVGDKLNLTTNVCQMYGSLEIGQVQLLVPQPGEWAYMELNPYEEADMQPCGDGSYEMVLHQDPRFSARRSVWHNFPGVKEWRTGDLFVPHSSKAGLWRFHARLDDLIVLSSGHKLRPLEMETLLQGDALLSGALIVGQGKAEPLLLVEPKPGLFDGRSSTAFIDRIWPTIEEANKIAPLYAQITRSRVLITDPLKPFVRAPKGSVIRKLTAKAYVEEIDATYAELSTRIKPNNLAAEQAISSFILPGLKQFVRKHVEEHLHGVQLSESDNMFLCGLDSLGAASLSRSLQKGIATQIPGQSAARGGQTLSLRLIYMYPTIERLASVILDIITDRQVPNHFDGKDIEGMEHAVMEFTRCLQPTTDYQPDPKKRLNVAIIGPRGSLGPSIVRELVDSERVARIYCLNRGDDGQERMRSIFEHRNLPCNVEDERISFMPIELGKPHLGLSPTHLVELLRNADVIIHNAWRVDFSWTLDAYKETYLRSIPELVDICSLSTRKARIAFVSSVSSVQEWAAAFPDRPVAEEPLESYEVASPLGYGQSKHVAERMLSRASVERGTPVTILRVGQVAGPTDPGNSNGVWKWSTDEWIPSLAAISKTLRLVPADIPPIDWVPVDLASRAIVELALGSRSGEEGAGEDDSSLQVFNVVNPNLSEWSVFASAVQKRLGIDVCRQTTLAEWVDVLVRTDPSTMLEAEARSSTKILPFFQHLAETAARGFLLQPKFDTTKAVAHSGTMRAMDGIDEVLINKWLEQWGL